MDFLLESGETTIEPAPLSPEEQALLGQQSRLLEQSIASRDVAAPLQQGLVESALGNLNLEGQRTAALSSALSPSVQQQIAQSQVGLQQGLLGFQQDQLGRLSQADQAALQNTLSQSGLLQRTISDLTRDQGLTNRIRDLERANVNQQFGRLGAEGQLIRAQLAQQARGIAPTPAQQALINSIAASTLASGTTDIERFQTQALDQLKNEFAPASGLRPSDTPVLDRAGDVQAEALRQFGQLAQNVRGQAAQASLNFPLASAQTLGQQNLAQQSLLRGGQEFQSLLRQNATNNRLAAAQGAPNFGLVPFQPQIPGISSGTLGLATQGGLSTLGGSVPSFNQGSTTTTTGGFTDLLGAFGGASLGLASLLNQG